MDLNKVTLIGTMAGQPKLRTGSRTGVKFVRFNLATQYHYLNGLKQGVSTSSHVCLAKKKLAEIIATYVNDGSRIYVEGSLNPRGGILVENMIMLGHRMKK